MEEESLGGNGMGRALTYSFWESLGIRDICCMYS
jgi:hypothetical protein